MYSPSVELIKNLEKDRFELPSVHTNRHDDVSDVDDSDCEINHLALDNLCGDLTEELMDDSSLDLSTCSVQHAKNNKKQVRVQTSNRGRKAKKQIVFK